MSALAQLPDVSLPEHDYVLAAPIGVGFCGRDRNRNVDLLIPVREPRSAVARRTAAIRIFPAQNITFAYHDREWTDRAAIIECLDEALLQTFVALAVDLSTRFPANVLRPSWDEVVEVIDEWQRLLARRSKLGPERELGLWGELKFILDSPSPDQVMGHWRGPTGALIDFDSPLNVEVKTSFFEHEHETPYDQLAALTENDGHIVSFWVESDPSGESLPDLVTRLCLTAPSSLLLMRELLRAGYVTADSDAYITRYRFRGLPLWLRAATVPCVREFDEGVLDVRFRVRLSPEAAMSPTEIPQFWSRLVPEDEQ
ncbi:MAG TPA: PD-(D/E)XK motif protein [Terriglobales bacterium]